MARVRSLRKASGLLVPAFVLAVGLSAGEQVVLGPTPNPFDPVQLQKESIGAWMRHPFHHVRKTWDDYFKVWPKPREDHHPTTLAKMRADPAFFQERNVEFDIFFNKRGTFFRQLISPFHKDHFVNFSCWAYGAELWQREARMDVYPLLYVKIDDAEGGEFIRRLDAYPQFTALHVWGRVVTVGEGMPWIQLTDAEPLKEPPLSNNALRDLELASRLVERKAYALAIQNFHAALALNLPHWTNRRIYEAVGQCHLELGQFAQAREALILGLQMYGRPRIQLAKALEGAPEAVPTLLRLTRADLALGNFREAQSAAEATLKLQPENAVAHAELGLALARQGQLREGRLAIANAHRLAPGGKLAEAHRNMAAIHIQAGDWKAAEAELTQAVLRRANDSLYHGELGDVYLALKDGKKAQTQFENASRLAPERPEPLHKLALAFKLQGDAASAQGKKDEATQLYQQALSRIEACHQLDEAYAPAYQAHAEILRALGREEDARKILDQGASSLPKEVSLQDYLQDFCRSKGDWAGVAKAADAAAALEPQSAARQLQLGHLRAFRAEQPDLAGAERAYARAVELDPALGEAWAHLALVRTKQKQWAAGALAAEEAVRRDAGNQAVWTVLGLCRRHLGDWQGSVAASEKAFALESTLCTRSNLAYAYLLRGQSGDLELARSLAKLALAEAPDAGSPERAQAQAVLGAALCQAHQREEALAQLKAAAEKLGDDPWNLLYQGRCLVGSDAIEQTLATFKKAETLAAADQSDSRLMARIVKEAREGEKIARKAHREQAIAVSLKRDAEPAAAQEPGAPANADQAPAPAAAPPTAGKPDEPAPAKTSQSNRPPVIQNEGEPQPMDSNRGGEVEAR